MVDRPYNFKRPAGDGGEIDDGVRRDDIGGWVLLIAGGDRAALERLYRAMQGTVYGLSLAILKNREAAEDVTQETFLKVWQSAGQHRAEADARAWILTIARNLAFAQFRVRETAAPADRLFEGQSDDPAGRVLDRLLLQQLFTALDEEERQIVVLYAVGSYRHREIAALLGRPCATVRWKFRRALGKLAAVLPAEAGEIRAEKTGKAEKVKK